MAKKLTAQDATESMSAHMAAKGADIREMYGPRIGWSELIRILDDRTVCRYPCEVVFDMEPLGEGEFGFAEQKGELPEDGFILYIHPLFQLQLDKVPYLALYQLAAVNYGDFASADDAEVFGAQALGIPQEEYYQALCEMADSLPAPLSRPGCS